MSLNFNFIDHIRGMSSIKVNIILKKDFIYIDICLEWQAVLQGQAEFLVTPKFGVLLRIRSN